MFKKSRTAECSGTQPSRSIRTDRVVPAAFGEQYRNNGFWTQLPARLRRRLRHRDRWRARDMLVEREQHSEISDIELWRRLYLPGDLVRVGDVLAPAHVAHPAEYCSGCTWSADGRCIDSVAYCLSAADLLDGVTYRDRMTSREACEAVLGRMRAAGWALLLVVDDDEGLLELWADAWCTPSDGRVADCPGRARGRCPGGTNGHSGQAQRVIWACDGLWEPWSEEEYALRSADEAPDWLEAHVDWLISLGGGRDGR